MLEKLFASSCPKCGEIYQSCEFAKIHLGPGAHVNMTCPNNHKWTEFYSLTYQGFWWDGKLYDSYGEHKVQEQN